MLIRGFRSPVVAGLVMYWQMGLAVLASVALVAAMLLVPELPPVPEAPLSWSGLVRSGLPRAAGVGCAASPWW